jgi:hypothetical protein
MPQKIFEPFFGVTRVTVMRLKVLDFEFRIPGAESFWDWSSEPL